jgi:CheY-like chemotaxis protein
VIWARRCGRWRFEGLSRDCGAIPNESVRLCVDVTAPAQLLVVDDEVLFATYLKEKFEELGYSVAVAADAVGAMAFIRSWQKPIVVLLDLMLPRVTGEALLREVAQGAHAASTRFVLVSAHQRVEGLAAGHPLVAGRMQKPVDMGELTRLVAQASRALVPAGAA